MKGKIYIALAAILVFSLALVSCTAEPDEAVIEERAKKMAEDMAPKIAETMVPEMAKKMADEMVKEQMMGG